MIDHDIPTSPAGLKAKGEALWRDLHSIFDFSSDPHRAVLIEEACRTADLIDRLQGIVDSSDDIRVRGSQGQPVAIPELSDLRQYRALLASLLKSLSLPDTEELQEVKQKHISDVRRAAVKVRYQ